MALTDAQRLAYADLRGILRRVVVAGKQSVDGPGEPIHLNGPSPVCGPGEQGIGRFGGVLEVVGSFRDDGDDPGTLSMGQVAHAAAEILVTSERVVFSLVHGSTRAGEAADRHVVMVFDYPWELVESVETPRKTSMVDRIAGGRPVTLLCLSAGAAMLKVIVRSELSAPPGSEPVRKARPDDFIRMLVTAGGRWRLRSASAPEAARVARVMEGGYVQEEDSLVAYLVDPEATPSDLADAKQADERHRDSPGTAQEGRGPRAGHAALAGTADGDVDATTETGGSDAAVTTDHRASTTYIDDAGGGAEPPDSSETGEAEAAPIPMCPSCGAPAASEHRFCRACGQRLRPTAQPPTNAARTPRRPQPATAPEAATRAMAPVKVARGGGLGASRSRRAFRALGVACGVLVAGAVVLMAITLSKERSSGDRTVTTSFTSSTEVAGSPGAMAGAESPTETVAGGGYDFQVPAGPGWSVGEPTTANGDALVERRINGPGGIVIRVVHTPRERARPDPDAVVSVAPFESAVPDSEVFTVSGFPTAECERTTCDDFVLNAPEFGGLAFLASDSGGPASQAARTMAGTLSVGGASPERTGYVIETSDDSPAQFGSFRDDGGSPAGRALRGAFGEPTSQTPSERGCDLQWVAIGVTAELTTYGQGVDACEAGYFLRARLHGAMWRTPTGLRVGSPVEEADAEDVCAPRGQTECAGEGPFYPDGSTLAVHDIECAAGLFPSVIATATGGRVDGFWVYTDGCE